ncbi:hypothetical protein EP837_02742 [Sphingobium sp. EP60837]|nr:hypothetical protein EP837_02742 [Sphingobium sp. EP60837]
MAFDQGTDAGMQTMKRFTMGWKNEHIVRYFLADRLKGLQPVSERICRGL